MLTRFFVTLENKLQSEKGQGLVEYALIIVLVSIACFAVLQALGVQVGTIFTDIKGKLTPAAGS